MTDCVGWDLGQGSVITDRKTGFISWEKYPYNLTNYPDVDPPVPGNPCRYDELKPPIEGSNGFTNTTAVPGDAGEDQFAAFVHHNGPVQAGIYAPMFGRRDNTTCNGVGGGCWVTKESCALDAGKDIDHSITIIGYGVDHATNPATGQKYGDYWLVKNSW
jgi:hypothetical protein